MYEDDKPVMSHETARFLLRELEKIILDDLAKYPEEREELLKELGSVREKLDKYWKHFGQS